MDIPGTPPAGDLTQEALLCWIRRHYEGGRTLRELAHELGWSEESVRQVMVDAGIPRRPRGSPRGKHLPSGGMVLDRDGYVLVLAPDHPAANASGYVREHRVVMEAVLGRSLEVGEVVRHINGILDDNRPENLALYASDAELKHEQLAGNSRARGDVGNPKRSVRQDRSPEELLEAIGRLALSLGRPIGRIDLQPPHPSYRAVAHAFGSWRRGVELAIERLEGLQGNGPMTPAPSA